MIATLQIPRMLFGVGAISALAAELEALGVSKPMLVTDQGLVKAGVAAAVRDALGKDLTPVMFDNVTENPIFADADSGVALYRREGCDGVIAVGGGSVIDTAKYIALLATNTGTVANYAGVPNASHGAAAPLVAIPTTAGTGSEADGSAGIHPDPTSPAVGMGSKKLIPKLAILDPNLTVSLPPRLTAATGIDAISHCIEGYLSKNDIPLGETIALDGLRRAMRFIRRATADGKDIEARGQMMLAAFAGGVAIEMGLGPAHAVAITCGDQGFHHGILSGIGLVSTLDLTAVHQPERVADCARAMGVDPTRSLAQAVASLMRELGLPATLGELNYKAGDMQSLAQLAHKSHFNMASRYHPLALEYAAMMEASLSPGSLRPASNTPEG
ncbi:MAG: iron-containing alcohol dehydrogenase [Variovorax sp.]